MTYTHGARIDAPLDVVRHNFAGSPFAIVLHANFRGENDTGTDTTGARFGCPPTTTFDCLDLDWPAQFGLLFQQVVRDSVEQLQGEAGPTGIGVARGQRGAWEEYWYDALGRRVLKRTRTDSLCQAGVNAEVCFSTMERYVWDGDQLLYELRFDGGDNQSINLNRTASTTSEGRKEQFGWLAYTHGAGIDAPLDVVRHNFAGSPFAIVLHANFRGENDAGTDTTGARFGCPPTTTFDCLDLDWPAQFGFAFHDQDGVRDPPVWIGSLIQSQRDASGLLYRRNRYYDPVTGQFTQSDPIGLAGGLNLYGFVGGDPVNFSDLFGLCPEDQQDEDGNCPGGLTVEEWDAVLLALEQLQKQAREQLTNMLESGGIRGESRPGRAEARVTPLSRDVIRVNRSFTAFGREGSVFDFDAGYLALVLGHEVRHVQQLENFGFLTRLLWGLTSKAFRDAIERDADAWARAQQVRR